MNLLLPIIFTAAHLFSSLSNPAIEESEEEIEAAATEYEESEEMFFEDMEIVEDWEDELFFEEELPES